MKESVSTTLIRSMSCGLIYSIMSIVCGWLFHSSIIMLDGFFTIISTVMSLVSLYIAKYIQKEDFVNFPFGKEVLAPLIVMINYIIILIVSVIGINDALAGMIMDHTIETDYVVGLVYAVISMFTCLVVVKLLARGAGSHQLITVEIKQWRFGMFFSLGVLVSFIVALLLEGLGYHRLSRLIDPLVSIGITLSFMVIAFKEIKQSLREVLNGTPKLAIKEKITSIITHSFSGYCIKQRVIRTAKVGDRLIVEIDVVITPDTVLDTVLEQDKLRHRLQTYLTAACHSHNIWLNLNFTGDAALLD